MPSEEHRFDVFGRTMVAVRRAPGEGWQVVVQGQDGKRGPAGVVVPAFIESDELAQFLADLFHESARPGTGEVRRLAREPAAGQDADPSPA